MLCHVRRKTSPSFVWHPQHSFHLNCSLISWVCSLVIDKSEVEPCNKSPYNLSVASRQLTSWDHLRLTAELKYLEAYLFPTATHGELTFVTLLIKFFQQIIANTTWLQPHCLFNKHIFRADATPATSSKFIPFFFESIVPGLTFHSHQLFHAFFLKRYLAHVQLIPILALLHRAFELSLWL